MASSVDDIQDDWFENVENFRPLRGGRRAETLNEVASGYKRVTNKDAERKFQECFVASKNNTEDPLAEMCKFVVWFDEHFPSGKYRLFYPMLYKICTIFCVMSQYKNDERMLKLWLKLAASFPESGFAVMEFAFTKGSCRQLAKFYIRWSEMEKLMLGKKMHAIPLTDLHTAQDELEAKIMTLTKKQADDNDSDNDMEEESDPDSLGNRETLAKLRGLGRKHHAPVFRIAQGPPGKIKQYEPISATQNTFEVFVEDNTVSNDISFNKLNLENSLSDELKKDPDFQALFGFFDYREKVDLHFSNVENLSKSSQPMENCRLTNKRPIEIEPEFEVYTDEIDERKKPVIVEKTKSRMRLRLSKRFVKEMSIEEGYSLKLYPK